MSRTIDVQARKRFGQHFLTDPNILKKLVGAAEIQIGDKVIEVGPGLGHLTRALLAAGAHVLAIEIDRDLAARLKQETGSVSGLTVVEGDFLAADPGDWLAMAGFDAADYKVVANLPYYITSQVLRSLLETSRPPTVMAIMVQREVALELTAKPGSMSLLAISVQFYGTPRIVSHVPAGAFVPRPKVDSAIVRIQVERPSRFPDVDSQDFFRLVRAGFGGRRKQLRNSLSRGLDTSAETVDQKLLRAGVDPRRRAETLSLQEWHDLYTSFSAT